MLFRQFTFLPNEGRADKPQVADPARYSHWKRYNTFYGLVFTTFLCSLLLAADLLEWHATGVFFRTVNDFPGTVALLVQLLSSFFGLIHVAVVCRLLNYALRIRLNRVSVTLDMLRTWVDMTIPRVDWDLPIRFFIPVMLVVLVSLVPAALWAGSIVPIVAPSQATGTLFLPNFKNVSLIKEYPLEIGKAGPSTRNQKGLFTYSVGSLHARDLLSSAASASTRGKRPRVHAKFDNTQFAYAGRSYGVGAAVGLGDFQISSRMHVAGYVYEEEGYLCDVMCMYNSSSAFTISGPISDWIYAASGTLPDSVDGSEFSNYIGLDGGAIVALGVANSAQSPRRFLSIAAGKNYAFLNNTQCEFDFTPTLFNVTVDLINNNITVSPMNTVADFNPDRNLTRTLVRQFALMSNDLTNLYTSLLGDALNSSIAAYNMSSAMSSPSTLSWTEATLGGLRNSLIAMADDMLVAYGSAQLMVGRMSKPSTATVYSFTMRFGQPVYIYLTFSLNMVILAAVGIEAVRTRGWKQLSRFNYLDPRDLIVSASRGGANVSAAADELAMDRRRKRMKRVWLLSDPDDGSGGLSIRVGNDAGHAAILLKEEEETSDYEDWATDTVRGSFEKERKM